MDLDDIFQSIGSFLGVEEGLTTVDGIRELLDTFAAMLNEDLPDVGDFQASVPYRTVDGQPLTLDVIVPESDPPFPVLVYLHGGAWVWGSPATHRKLTFRLAEQGFLTLSVDYRLAPEHPFPCGFNDCVHAIHYAAHNAQRWGGDPRHLVLAGDSAGANLAAAAAIDLAHTADAPDAPTISALGLLYGVFDFTGIQSDGITQLLAEAYLGDDAGQLTDDPRVSPIVGAKRLPPVHIAVGGADPLIEDAEALRSVLARAGKVHDYRLYEDMPHAFAQMEFLPDARPAIQRLTEFLHDTLNR